MKILLTVPKGDIFDRHFPPELLERLGRLGELTINPHKRQYTRAELSGLLSDTDIVLTHWGSTQYDGELLDRAPGLKLLAHCAGTVAHIASEEFYRRGIPVLSANTIMARYVAEGVLGYILAGLRSLPQYDRDMRIGHWRGQGNPVRSLMDIEVGMIGLGTVGRFLLELLSPFGCRVRVYDPYISADALDGWEFARRADFDEAMRCPLVTIHASQTPETYHMIGSDALRLMPDGGLLVNSSRGSLVDTDALISELESGRIGAVLDVYEHEGCAQDPRLLACGNNTILQPHLAAYAAGSRMTSAIIDDIERFLRGEPMRLTVSREQYLHMTQE